MERDIKNIKNRQRQSNHEHRRRSRFSFGCLSINRLVRLPMDFTSKWSFCSHMHVKRGQRYRPLVNLCNLCATNGTHSSPCHRFISFIEYSSIGACVCRENPKSNHSMSYWKTLLFSHWPCLRFNINRWMPFCVAVTVIADGWTHCVQHAFNSLCFAGRSI